LPRKRDIEAAIAAHNNTNDRELQFLPRDAARLLAVMFPRRSACQCSLGDLIAKGFDERTVRRLLRALADAGFLSKEPTWRDLVPTYHLHLPPRRQP
jgi:hypothetical protein